MERHISHNKNLIKLKNNLAQTNNYPQPSIKYWSLFETYHRGHEVIDIRKNIKIYEKRVSKFGVILRRVVSKSSVTWFVLGCDSKTKKIQIYAYVLGLYNFAGDKIFDRHNVGLISHHALQRLIERRYLSINEALYIAAQTIASELIRITEDCTERSKMITQYSEKCVISFDNNGLFGVGYEPPLPSAEIGKLVLKTYIDESIAQEWNYEDAYSDYYHVDFCQDIDLKTFAIEDMNALMREISIPKRLKIEKEDMDVRFDFEYFQNRLQKLED